MTSTSSFLGSVEAHPIFSQEHDDRKKELSLSVLSVLDDASPSTSARPQRAFCLRDADAIFAVGNQIRMAPLSIDGKPRRDYKTLDASSISFTVYQIVPSPNGKLLAVAGLHQVAVVVLPRPTYWKTNQSTVTVTSLSIGEDHHKRKGSPRVVKLDWHPWGENGATLLVATADGSVREYDVSQKPDEPQQTVSFIRPGRKTFLADASTRELVSFRLGTGRADWGPLTLYGLLKNGDLYAIAPYMPARAAIPPSYIWSLEYYVKEKLEAAHRRPGFAALYEQQLRYVSALASQLPSNKALTNSVVVHAPPAMSNFSVARQGPFLFQPEPHDLVGSPGGDAVDVLYLSLTARLGKQEGCGDTLDVVLVLFQDGKIDVCLDLDKVEARWEHGQFPDEDLPLLTVFETIDLGLLKSLKDIPSRSTDIEDTLACNFAQFYVDPLYSDTIYVTHLLGVHCLLLRRWIDSLLCTLATDESAQKAEVDLRKTGGTDAFILLDTSADGSKDVVPIIGLAVANNVSLPYSLIAVTPVQCTLFELSLRTDTTQPPLWRATLSENKSKTTEEKGIVCLMEPWTVPAVLSRPRPTLAARTFGGKELQVTTDSVRLLTSEAQKLQGEIAIVIAAKQEVQTRLRALLIEYHRQLSAAAALHKLLARIKGPSAVRVQTRVVAVLERQRALVERLDKTVQNLIDAACPVLSEHESAWFDELKRHRKNVLDSSSGQSFVSRFEALESGYDQLLPALQDLAKNKHNKPTAPMGSSQALRIGRRLGEESRVIEELTAKLKDLCARLGVP